MSDRGLIREAIDIWGRREPAPESLLTYDPGERFFLDVLWLALAEEEYRDDLPAFGQNVYPSFTRVAAACLWLEDSAGEIYRSVCVEGRICERLQQEGDIVSFASLVADSLLMSHLLPGIPVTTLSVLLAKIGLRKICQCVGGEPTRPKNNPFSSLTERYFRDATASHPRAHKDAFVYVAELHLKRNHPELAIARLEDAELWVREQKQIKLPDDFVTLQDVNANEWDGYPVGPEFDLMRKKTIFFSGRFPQSPEDRKRREMKKIQDKAKSLNNIGYLYMELNNFAKAGELIEEAVELCPARAGIVDSLGWLRFKQGDFDEACRILKNAVALDSKFSYQDNSLELRYHLVATLCSLGETREASQILSTMSDKNSSSIWVKISSNLIRNSSNDQ